MNNLNNTIKNLYLYQKERFPVSVLVISLYPALLSASVVSIPHASLFRIILALIASVAYLAIIRVIDEKRDFEHDNLYHKDRPVQRGLVSIKELEIISLVSFCLLVIVALFGNKYSILVLIFMLCYSYLAGKEFFVGEKIRKYFFIYNLVNIFQLFLMQCFVYTLFFTFIKSTEFIIAHFIFTAVGTIIFEFVRKLKLPGADGGGDDTYTYYLGFERSVYIFIALSVLNLLAFWWLLSVFATKMFIIITISVLGFVSIIIASLKHIKNKSNKTELFMQSAFLLVYSVLNIAVYILNVI